MCNISFELATTSEKGTKGFPTHFTLRRRFLGDLYFARWLVLGGIVSLTLAIFRPWTLAAEWGLATFVICGALVLLFRYVELFTYNNQTREAFEKEQRLWNGGVDNWMAAYLAEDLDKAGAKLKRAAQAYVCHHGAVINLRKELFEMLVTTSQQITKLAHLLNDRVLLQFWEQGDECAKSLSRVVETQGKLEEALKAHDAALNEVMGEIEAVRNIDVNHEVAGGVRLIGWMHGEAVGDIHLLPETWVSESAHLVKQELNRLKANYAELLTLAQRMPELVAVLQRRMIVQELESTRETMKQEFRLLASTITAVEAKLNAKIEDAAVRLEAAAHQSAKLVSQAVHSAASRVSSHVSLSAK